MNDLPGRPFLTDVKQLLVDQILEGRYERPPQSMDDVTPEVALALGEWTGERLKRGAPASWCEERIALFFEWAQTLQSLIETVKVPPLPPLGSTIRLTRDHWAMEVDDMIRREPLVVVRYATSVAGYEDGAEPVGGVYLRVNDCHGTNWEVNPDFVEIIPKA